MENDFADAGAESSVSGLIHRMTESLRHRGPDDSGVWADPHLPLVLGHRRLSILDTSARGRQPMVSPSGRFVITYNGEVYNFAEIRELLALTPAERVERLIATVAVWDAIRTRAESSTESA